MLRIYATLLRMGWAIVMEYRAQIVIWMTNSLLTIVFMLVWLSISRDGPINGYESADFVAYFIVAWVVRNFTAVWASWELDYAIREGRLSPMLLRPLHPIHHEIAINWAEKGIRLFLVLPLAALGLVIWPEAAARLDWSLLNIALFLVSLALAWLILFMSDYLLGILAFWTTQATAFVQGFFGLRLLLSGTVMPLAMFPAALQQVLRYTPFPYMLHFNVDIAMGRVRGEELLIGLTLQLAWALTCTALVHLLWRAAIRSYSAVGA
ncbi:MAG: ABC transporter permease [Thermoflexales bacterium]